jgi:hypothetical protein
VRTLCVLGYCPEGASSERECAAGYYCPDLASQIALTSGHFAVNADGDYVVEGGVSESVCEAGTYCANGVVFQCEAGTYVP